ncbi:hypothetical protein [Pediococcus acidilactici]|uniref:hypothetical protein n=1 Tax=Pediococcus acidilactici TaxID=1254 RepID=UPI002F263A5E
MVKMLIKYGAAGAFLIMASAIVLTKLPLSSLTVDRAMLAISLLIFLGLGVALKKHA